MLEAYQAFADYTDMMELFRAPRRAGGPGRRSARRVVTIAGQRGRPRRAVAARDRSST